MLTIEKLIEYGADTADGLERCLNDESFYLELIPSALDRANYERIETSVRSGDLDHAFEAAHALKGVLGNLALTPIYTPVSEMTELLRARRADADYEGLLRQMWEARDALEALL